METLNHLLGDPTFWVMLSTVLCFGFIGWKAWRPILVMLDARAVSIAQRLSEAEALRREAEDILTEYKQKRANALHEAQDVLKNAELRVTQLRDDMEAELRTALTRQENNAKMRLQRLEAETIEAVKAAVINAALTHAQSQVANDAGSAEDSLDAIGKTLQ